MSWKKPACPPVGPGEECEDYCNRVPQSCCGSCWVGGSGGTSGGGTFIIRTTREASAPEHVYMFLALQGQPFEILNDHVYLQPTFVATILPHIASGDMLAEMEAFAEELFGAEHDAPKLALHELSSAFSKLREGVLRVIADRHAAPEDHIQSLAARLKDLVNGLTGIALEPLDALDIGRYATDDPAILIAFARELMQRAPDQALVREAHLQFIEEIYRDALSLCDLNDPYERDLAKIALMERESNYSKLRELSLQHINHRNAAVYERAGARMQTYLTKLP